MKPETRRLFGFIIFPGEPEKVVQNVWLNISKDSIYLEGPFESSTYEDWPVIIGQFTGMDKATLVQCRAGGGSIGSGGAYEKIWVTYLIEDYRQPSYEWMKFNKVTLISEALDRWILEPVGINSKDLENFNIPKKQEIVRAKVNDLEIVVNLEFSKEYGSKILNSKRICTVYIISDAAIHIDSFFEAIRRLKKLILFFTNKNSEFEEYIFHDELDTYSLINTFKPLHDDKFSQYLEVFYRQVKPTLDSIIKKWFETKTLHTVIDLVLEKGMNTEMSSQGFFLNVIVGLEYFHSEFSSNKNVGPTDYLENKKAIIALIGTDETLLKWFKSKTKEWDKPTLALRLNDYKSIIETIIGNVFGLTIDEFMQKVKQTRNEMAHTGVYLKRFTNFELFLASKTIEYVLRIEIFKILGLDGDKWIPEAKRNIGVLAHINNYLSEKALKSLKP